MKQLRNILNKSLNVLAGGSFLAMTVFTCWQVITRYLLGNPSSWSEELVSYLFAWMSLFGATLVVGERGHMNIPILVDKASEKVQKILAIVAEVIAMIFAIVILVYGGMQITTLAMGQQTSSLGVAVGVFYVVMPIAGVLMAIYTVLNIVDIVKGNISLTVANEVDQAIEKVENEEV